MATVKVTGGNKLRRKLRQIERKIRTAPHAVDIGFFSTAVYPPVHTGVRGGRRQKSLPVATVAAWNELGNKRIPERPFIRPAVEASKRDVTEIILESKEVIDDRTAGLIGELIKGRIQEKIIEVDRPANAASVIERKQKTKGKGTTTPLVDTGKMLNSVTWQIE